MLVKSFFCLGVILSCSFGTLENQEGRAQILAISDITTKISGTPGSTNDVYKLLDLELHGLDSTLFTIAKKGYEKLKREDLLGKSVITIVDFSKTSDQKRLWVIDLEGKELLFHTLVAHGRMSGELQATRFSNQMNSNMSSLGFYLTDALYHGKHGLSLRLIGLEKEINDKALARAIVMHGADYVSDSFVKRYGRLGRSLGCPAVPQALSDDIINAIANGSCLFIYSEDQQYQQMSKFAT